MIRKLGKIAMIAGAALAAPGLALADFTYSAAFTITSVSGGGTIVNTPLSGSDGTTMGGGTATVGGTTILLQDVNPTLHFTVPTPVPDTINIGNVAVTSTSLNSAPDSFTITYTDDVTINNLGNPGFAASGTFHLTGTITLTDVSGVPGNTGDVTNVFDNPSGQGPLGGVYYIGQAVNFSNLTINGCADRQQLRRDHLGRARADDVRPAGRRRPDPSGPGPPPQGAGRGLSPRTVPPPLRSPPAPRPDARPGGASPRAGGREVRVGAAGAFR